MDAMRTLGLTAEEASARLARVGPNRLFTPAPVRFWAIAAEELREPMILLLILIGVLYAFWGELRDAITIFAVIFLLVTAEVVATNSAPSAPSAPFRRFRSPRRGSGEAVRSL